MSQKIAYAIKDVCNIASIGRTKIYELIKTGELKTIKIGSRTLVTQSALDNWIKRLEKKEGK